MNASNMADQLDAFYETHDVHKCLLICKNDNELFAIVKELRLRHHTVNILDDDESLVQNLGSTHCRVLATTLSQVEKCMTDLERWVIPEHNLIAMGDIPVTDVERIQSWVRDANRRGFCPEFRCTEFLCLDSV